MKDHWIALDIDGTITHERYSVPSDVTSCLKELQASGWNLIFATGRSATFALRTLSAFDFPYTLLAQHGSIGLAMPEQNILFKSYLPTNAVDVVAENGSDFIAYGGYEDGDSGYIFSPLLSEAGKLYVETLKKREGIELKEGKPHHAALIKCFGTFEQMQSLEQTLQKRGVDWHMCLIRDPFLEGGAVLLITSGSASKGEAVKKLTGHAKKVIAAGDDENDVSLLQAATWKIAMPQAPESLKKCADYVADKGIVEALQRAAVW